MCFFVVVVFLLFVVVLHERAGSTNVIHLHGELRKARRTRDSSRVIDIGYDPIPIRSSESENEQLRPHIVWFGEEVMHFDVARNHVIDAAKFLVAGTSLSAFPAASLVKHARFDAEKIIVDIDPPEAPYGFRVLRGTVDAILPSLVDRWIVHQTTPDA